MGGDREALFTESVTRVTEGGGGGGPEGRDTLPSRGPAGAVAATATAYKIAKTIVFTVPFAPDCVNNHKKPYICWSFYNKLH